MTGAILNTGVYLEPLSMTLCLQEPCSTAPSGLPVSDHLAEAAGFVSPAFLDVLRSAVAQPPESELARMSGGDAVILSLNSFRLSYKKRLHLKCRWLKLK